MTGAKNLSDNFLFSAWLVVTCLLRGQANLDICLLSGYVFLLAKQLGKILLLIVCFDYQYSPTPRARTSDSDSRMYPISRSTVLRSQSPILLIAISSLHSIMLDVFHLLHINEHCFVQVPSLDYCTVIYESYHTSLVAERVVR